MERGAGGAAGDTLASFAFFLVQDLIAETRV